MLKREAKFDHLVDFLKRSLGCSNLWSTPLVRHAPFVFIIPSWLSNHKKASIAANRAIEAAFKLTKNLRPFVFITEESLQTYGLVSIEEPLEAQIIVVPVAEAPSAGRLKFQVLKICLP